MEALLEYLFLFCSCATAGWCLEVVYRAFRHRKVVNPGFLTGCCLPIYGTGGMILYWLSSMKFRSLPNEYLRVAAILLIAMVIMTLIELVGGLVAVKYFRVKLWDYSGEWMNFQGVICPKFSLIWGVVAAAVIRLIPRLDAVIELLREPVWYAVSFALLTMIIVDSKLEMMKRREAKMTR